MNSSTVERSIVPQGRDFMQAAKEELRGPTREGMIRPGDYITDVPVSFVASWYGGEPLDSFLPQERLARTEGTTRVEVVDIINFGEGEVTRGLKQITFRTDKDGIVKGPVSASLFSGYNAPYWWQGNLVYGHHVS